MIKKTSAPIITSGIFALYFLIGALILRGYQFQINPDSISYINIARLFLAGEWRLAANNHWNPLISWLLMPLLKMGMPGLAAAKVLGLCIGGATLLMLAAEMAGFGLKKCEYSFALIAAIPILLWMAFAVNSPDLLLALLLVGYLALLRRNRDLKRPLLAAAAGAAGGLAALAKYYAVPFFLVHYTLYFLLLWRNREEGRPARLKNLFTHYALGLIVFLLVTGSWSRVIQQKYQSHSFSHHTNGYVLTLLDPAHPNPPVEWLGLLDLPYAQATSIWDDPSAIKMAYWAPWQSSSAFQDYLHTIRRFLVRTLTVFMEFSPFSFALILLFLLLAVSKKQKYLNLSPAEALRYLLPAAIFTCGYELLWIEERYLFFVQLLFLLMFCQIMAALPERKLDRRSRTLIVGVVLASFVLFPIQKLAHYHGIDRQFHDQAERIGRILDLKDKRIAANKYWQESLYLSFYRGGKFIGSCGPAGSGEEILLSLQQKKIDYLFFWGRKNDMRYDWLQNYPEVSGAAVEGLSIFCLDIPRH